MCTKALKRKKKLIYNWGPTYTLNIKSQPLLAACHQADQPISWWLVPV